MNVRFWLTFTCLLCLCATARAEDKLYIGGAGTGSWAANANWSPIGAPEGDDNALLTPTDASNRTVMFDPTGQFLFSYGSVTVSSSGGGSITLLNSNNTFETQALTVGTRGAFAQQQSATATVDEVFVNGGTISSTGGTFNAGSVTHNSGQLGFGTYTVQQRYALLGGVLNNATLTSNGIFEFTGGGASGGRLVNNGALVLGGSASLNMHVENRGSITFNENGRFLSFDNFVAMTLPAGRTLSANTSGVGGITLSDATFTQLGTVRGDRMRIRGGTWEQQGGFLQANSSPGEFIVGVDGFNGAYRMSDGTAFFADVVTIGATNSVGSFAQAGGSISATRAPTVGGNGGSGHMNISGGSLTTGGLLVGATGAVAATYTQSGGAVQLGSLTVGQDAATPASMTISGGSLSVSSLAVNNRAITHTGGSVVLTSGLTGSGSLVVGGGGSLTATSIAQKSVHLSGQGRIKTGDAVNRVESVTFVESTVPLSGTWDLDDGALIVDYPGGGVSPAAAIRRYLVSGFAGGAWTGTGLQSSAAAAPNPPNTALGFAESAQLFGSSGGTFLGQSVDGTAVLVRHTLYGDANLDHQVNLQDFNRLATNFGLASGATWAQGDFNFDGVVNLQDFNRLAANFGLSAAGPDVTPQDWANLGAAVPEPSAALLGVSLTVALLTSRRRSPD
jgi:hypothetical protein